MTSARTIPRLADLKPEQLLVLAQTLPANGRDVLVRLGAAAPDVDEAHDCWLRLGLDDLARLKQETKKPEAVHALTGLVLYAQATRAEAGRRRSKVGDLFVLLCHGAEDWPEKAHAELLRRLRPPMLRGETPAEARQRALVALFDSWTKHEQTGAALRLSDRVEACPYRWVGPAPSGWEADNQRALENDIQLALTMVWPAFKVGPWEARDATAATVRRATRKKRDGGLKRVPFDLQAVRRTQERVARQDQQDSKEQARAERWADAILHAQRPGPLRRALELIMDGKTRDQAADAAGVTRMTLYRQLKKLARPE